eukprot:CAMPEP_0198132708 /NCGR_PEP_ID=MMETSP1442-20131203/58924_1 /TAXON_ID= /ORGANISM="Craspedostauros australis, Strain CCMP3328" /LENGTH=43 /DNA_ID= /DNA_START= /DNA_END= /DNA_ORIENTATION=
MTAIPTVTSPSPTTTAAIAEEMAERRADHRTRTSSSQNDGRVG